MAYEKQTWANGDVITSEKLNYMESGIGEAGEQIGSLSETVSGLTSDLEQLRSRVGSLAGDTEETTEVEHEVSLTLVSAATISKRNATTTIPGTMSTTSTSNTAYKVTEPVDVTSSAAVIVSGWAGTDYGMYSFLDSDGNVVLCEWNDAAGAFENLRVDVPDGASTIIVSGHSGYKNPSLVLVEVTTTIVEAVPFRWLLLGDSLTASVSTCSKHYYEYIQDALRCETEVVAVSGTGYIHGDTPFYQQVANATIAPDVITIFGSGNDLNDTLGDVADTGTDTVCGCVRATIDAIRAAYPLVPIGVITTVPWGSYSPDNTTNAMAVMVEKQVELCRRMGVPCLDLYHSSNLRPWDEAFRAMAYTQDTSSNGVHPDANGHKMIAGQIQAFVQSLIVHR